MKYICDASGGPEGDPHSSSKNSILVYTKNFRRELLSIMELPVYGVGYLNTAKKKA